MNQRKPNVFFKAVDDRRLHFNEIKYYSYIKTEAGKDVFLNKITGVYLD